jgi:hypothetical protein
MLTTWSIWKERNMRVFENSYKPIQIIIVQIKDEAKQWAAGSAGSFVLPLS